MSSSTRKHIGARIKAHRKVKKVTQESLAEVLDCEETTIGRYERGESSPDGEQLLLLAKFFETSPMDFLPTDSELKWQTIRDLRSTLIDKVYRIEDPKLLESLIASASLSKKA